MNQVWLEKKWLKLFLNRHKDKLSIRRPTGTSFARAFGFDKEKVESFFNPLEELYTKNNYPPNRIYKVITIVTESQSQ